MAYNPYRILDMSPQQWLLGSFQGQQYDSIQAQTPSTADPRLLQHIEGELDAIIPHPHDLRSPSVPSSHQEPLFDTYKYNHDIASHPWSSNFAGSSHPCIPSFDTTVQDNNTDTSVQPANQPLARFAHEHDWYQKKNYTSILFTHPAEVASWKERFGLLPEENTLVVQYFTQLNQVFPSTDQVIVRDILARRQEDVIAKHRFDLLHEHDPLRRFHRGVPPKGFTFDNIQYAPVQPSRYTKGQSAFQLPGYPPTYQPLPIGTTLVDIVQHYPNHLTYEFLDGFLQYGITAGNIYNCMPRTVQQAFVDHGLKTNTSAYNVIQKRFIRRRELLDDQVGFNAAEIDRLERYLFADIKNFELEDNPRSSSLVAGNSKYQKVDKLRNRLGEECAAQAQEDQVDAAHAVNRKANDRNEWDSSLAQTPNTREAQEDQYGVNHVSDADTAASMTLNPSAVELDPLPNLMTNRVEDAFEQAFGEDNNDWSARAEWVEELTGEEMMPNVDLNLSWLGMYQEPNPELFHLGSEHFDNTDSILSNLGDINDYHTNRSQPSKKRSWDEAELSEEVEGQEKRPRLRHRIATSRARRNDPTPKPTPIPSGRQGDLAMSPTAFHQPGQGKMPVPARKPRKIPVTKPLRVLSTRAVNQSNNIDSSSKKRKAEEVSEDSFDLVTNENALVLPRAKKQKDVAEKQAEADSEKRSELSIPPTLPDVAFDSGEDTGGLGQTLKEQLCSFCDSLYARYSQEEIDKMAQEHHEKSNVFHWD